MQRVELETLLLQCLLPFLVNFRALVLALKGVAVAVRAAYMEEGVLT